MTEAEALIALSLEGLEELEDAYDQKLFEFKQYLLTKVPFVKTYQSKSVQMDRIQYALEALNFEIPDEKVCIEMKVREASDDLLSCFTTHQSIMSVWKLKVGEAKNIKSLKCLMDEALSAYRFYALNWTSISGQVHYTEDVKASVELDPVDLIQALKTTKGKVERNELLMKETKRLFLWLNYNGNE